MRRGRERERERDEITTMDGPWLQQTDGSILPACLDRLRCRMGMGDHHLSRLGVDSGHGWIGGPPGDVVSAVQWMLRIALGASGRWVPLQGRC